mgnify:CR=1 FL=1
MTAAIRSEFRKFFTTRLWWGMAIAVILSGAAFAILFAFLFTSEAVVNDPDAVGIPTSDADLARAVFTAGISVGYLLTLSIGVMTIGSEYRHKTITVSRSQATSASFMASVESLTITTSRKKSCAAGG